MQCRISQVRGKVTGEIRAATELKLWTYLHSYAVFSSHELLIPAAITLHRRRKRGGSGGGGGRCQLATIRLIELPLNC